jgi:hypothetical protein
MALAHLQKVFPPAARLQRLISLVRKRSHPSVVDRLWFFAPDAGQGHPDASPSGRHVGSPSLDRLPPPSAGATGNGAPLRLLRNKGRHHQTVEQAPQLLKRHCGHTHANPRPSGPGMTARCLGSARPPSGKWRNSWHEHRPQDLPVRMSETRSNFIDAHAQDDDEASRDY